MKTIKKYPRPAFFAGGWSVYEVSLKSGVREEYIRRYEKDKIMPGILNAISLADAFGVSLDELVGRNQP